MSLLLVTSNTNLQTVETNEIINLGSVIRKYCKKINCVPTFNFTGQTISLLQSGIYEVSVNITFTGEVAGTATFQLEKNGVALTGATASETISVVDTEVRSVAFNFPILVNNTCVLNTLSTDLTNLTVVNTGIGTTIQNITVFVTKKV